MRIVKIAVEVILLYIVFTLTSSIVYAGNTQRVSISSDGEQANLSCYNPSISADGRFIAFESDADNLVLGDTNKSSDIFVYDRQIHEIQRVSISSDGIQTNHNSFAPSISADGRFVAFRSWASNLVSNDTNGKSDVFVHDSLNGKTQRVSISSDGVQANSDSITPSISAEGKYIAFQSYAANLVSGDTNERLDVFIHSMQTGITQRASISSEGNQGNANSGGISGGTSISISADGRFVAFDSWATNLVANDTNGCVDVFVHDMQTDKTNRVSISSNGLQSNNSSIFPCISADGRFIAFESLATNLLADDTIGNRNIFVHDNQTGETKIVSVSSNGVYANDNSWEPSISADGRFITFDSNADNLISNDTNGSRDVFVHDIQKGKTKRISISSSEKQANDNSDTSSISADGKYIAFNSDADNLISSDTNGTRDIFVYEMDIPVSSISLNKTELSLSKGASETLVAIIDPSNATNKNVTWSSSNVLVATVDSSGKVVAIGKGVSTINVTTEDGSKTASCKVTVSIPVTGVTLNKTTLSLNKGTTETLVATISPTDAVNKAVTWSSSNISVAAIDTNGLVTAVSEGNSIITVTTVDGEKTATCQVTVKIPVTEISLNKTILSLNKGTTETLVVSISPDNATNKTVTWTSNNDTIASVDNSGLVTAKSGGICNITATSVDSLKTATCQVTVISPVTGVTLNKTTLSLNRDATETLVATISPTDATNKAVTWTSNNTEVATVDKNGQVTGINEGNCIVTAASVDGEKTATCQVTVKIAVTGIFLNKTTLSLNKGSTDTLIATISPSDATNKTVTWLSSNAAVASVDSNGFVTAKSGGVCNIIATSVDSLKTATCKITVVAPVTGITLNKTSLLLDKSETETLIATVLPIDATNKAVTWSSNNSNVATVNTNGFVTAIGAGTAMITVMTIEGAKTATCQVDVNVPVTSVTLNKTTLSLEKGASETLVATITPTDAVNKAVNWTSSNNNIATVDPNGTVTAVNYGTCIITATTNDGFKTSNCFVNVQSMIYFTNPSTADSCDSYTKFITIGGKTDASITKVKWGIDNKRNGSCKLSKGVWSASKIGLVLGDNIITVTGTNKFKQTFTDTLLVKYIDNIYPVVKINSPTSKQTYKTTKEIINISGTVKDLEDIISVTWINMATGDSGVCKGTKSWKALAIALALDNNEIIFTAEDSSGNVGTDSIIVTRIDKTKPKVTILSPTNKTSLTLNEQNIVISGIASDNIEVAQIEWLNKSTGAIGICSGTTNWKCTIPLLVGKNNIVVIAIDTSINKSTNTITVTRKY